MSRQPLEYESHSGSRAARQSGFGLVSVACAGVSLVFDLACYAVAESTGSQNFTGRSMVGAAALGVVGAALGVLGTVQRGRRRSAGGWGTVLNLLIAATFIFALGRLA